VAISIPDVALVKIAHEYTHKPGVAKVAITAPGPLSVSATGTRPDGSALFEPTVAANRAAYVGYGLIPCSINRGITAVRDTVISGFAGVEPGNPVYVADDGTLTHTDPDPGVAVRIGMGFTPSLIVLD
jgi:hypothetical protein